MRQTQQNAVALAKWTAPVDHLNGALQPDMYQHPKSGRPDKATSLDLLPFDETAHQVLQVKVFI